MWYLIISFPDICALTYFAISKISAEETGLSLALSETQSTGFVKSWSNDLYLSHITTQIFKEGADPNVDL